MATYTVEVSTQRDSAQLYKTSEIARIHDCRAIQTIFLTALETYEDYETLAASYGFWRGLQRGSDEIVTIELKTLDESEVS